MESPDGAQPKHKKLCRLILIFNICFTTINCNLPIRSCSKDVDRSVHFSLIQAANWGRTGNTLYVLILLINLESSSCSNVWL